MHAPAVTPVACAAGTTEYLRSFEVTATYVTTAEAALDLLDRESAAIVLLDINLHSMSGFEFCRRLREASDAPIVFVSARSSDDDQIHALCGRGAPRLGAGDAGPVAKPAPPRWACMDGSGYRVDERG
ncbi:MAG TPA: response regulator [Jiangellaceae bacterium]|nr:response regulator [Jiangellaceae bacterium]